MTVLILGYGHLLGGDDAVGWHAAQMLAGMLRHPAVRVQSSQQLVPELAEEAARAAMVIFLDAAVDQPPGVVHCRRVQPEAPAVPLSHELSPGALLGLAERLYGGRPEAVLFSVGARQFSDGAGLSNEVCSALPVLLHEVCELVGRFLGAQGQWLPPEGPQEPEADIFSVMH